MPSPYDFSYMGSVYELFVEHKKVSDEGLIYRGTFHYTPLNRDAYVFDAHLTQIHYDPATVKQMVDMWEYKCGRKFNGHFEWRGMKLDPNTRIRDIQVDGHHLKLYPDIEHPIIAYEYSSEKDD